MPAYAQNRRIVRPRERIYALAAVVVVQAFLAVALLAGFHVEVSGSADLVERLVNVSLARQPPPPPPPPPLHRPQHHQRSAPKAEAQQPGGSPAPAPSHALPAVTPVVSVKPTSAPSGGGSGTGPALGAGAGGGKGGNGFGDDEGGSDLVQIAGEITSRDYPKDLRDAGVGGRVTFVFTVEPSGRVGRCAITRSSGVAELDSLTCRLVQQRFLYRPSTDRFGRPIEDEVDGEHDWIASRG